MSSWKERKAAEQAALAAQAEEAEKMDSLETIESALAEGVTELQQSFRDRMEKENKRFADVCDTEFYMTVCFKSRAQMTEFCESVGLNSEELYIDGKEFARKIGRAINTPDLKFPKTQAFNKDYVSRAREKGE